MKQFLKTLAGRPDAAAALQGSVDCPGISGYVRFYQTRDGVLVAAHIHGLPQTDTDIFGFHIHDVGTCSGSWDDPFGDTRGHYDPHGSPHPCHAGDLPSLLSCDGHAVLVFLTGRFRVGEIVGRPVIIHSHPDDFTTQPSGSAGTKIACGEIMRCR